MTTQKNQKNGTQQQNCVQNKIGSQKHKRGWLTGRLSIKNVISLITDHSKSTAQENEWRCEKDRSKTFLSGS